MQDFSKRIPVDEGFNPEFFFHRIYTVRGIGFHVSVVDKNKLSYFFNTEQTPHGWKITNAPKVPDWIMRVEEKISDAIGENMIE